MITVIIRYKGEHSSAKMFARDMISLGTVKKIREEEAIKPTIYPEIKEQTIDEKKVIRVDFSGTERPYSSYGRYYKRVFDRTEEMTPDELKHMMAQTDYSLYWENNLTQYGLESVDHISLDSYYKKAVSCGRLDPMPQYDEEVLLTGLGLYQDGKLTNAGYYLFSNKKPVVLKLAVYVTDERISFSDIDRIEDNIFNLIGRAFSYIKEHINWRVEPGNGTSRIEIPEIPIEAIREIVVNAMEGFKKLHHLAGAVCLKNATFFILRFLPEFAPVHQKAKWTYINLAGIV